MTGQVPLPYNVLIAAASDTPMADLAVRLEDERLRITACFTEEQAHRSLAAGLPDVGLLDGSLSGASLLRIYTGMRPERGTDLVPIVFTSHAYESPPVADHVPDRYLPVTAYAGLVEREIYRALDLPLPERKAAQPDPMARDLLVGLRGSGFDAATYVSADSALQELEGGLPAAAVLDASLPEDELIAVYETIRERPGGAELPVVFIHDPRCPAGAVVVSGADIYVGEGASIDEALELLRDRVAATAAASPAAAAPAPRRGLRWLLPETSNPLVKRILRALPIAAMVVIGGVAGVLTVRTFDTRSWPLAHPTEVSAATPGVTATTAAEAITEGGPLQGLATRAAGSSTTPSGNRTSRSTPEPVACALLPAFESMRDSIGADVVGTCVDQPTIRENGDAEQVTTRGLFAMTGERGWAAFTDGFRTWVNGPLGLQQRLNSERFPWESASSAIEQPAVAAPEREGLHLV